MGKFLFVLMGLVACSSPKAASPQVCCAPLDDCRQIGVPSEMDCNVGFLCVDHQCVAQTCSKDGCPTTSPVCNVATDVCEHCTDSSQCASYPGSGVCDPSTGACVGCSTGSDCPANKPVCAMYSCRACVADADCPSGACADDGSCVAASAIVYLDPGGADSGTCPATSPCLSITYGATQTSDSRPHIVMNTGSYVEAVSVQTAPAPLVYVHGGGSTLSAPTGTNGSAVTAAGVSIRNLTIVNSSGAGLSLTNSELRHVHLRSQLDGLTVAGHVTAVDTEIAGPGTGTSNGVVLHATDTVSLDRVNLHGWNVGLDVASVGGKVTIANTFVSDTTDLALDLTNADTSSVAFTTITAVGGARTTAPRAVACSTNVTVVSSILWLPGGTALVPLQGCSIATSIAGPVAIAGVSNADPKLLDIPLYEYHLAAGSPAVDFVQTGPDHDFDGDARPLGAGYDIGADEAR